VFVPALATKPQLRAELRARRRAITADPVDRADRSARIWTRIVPLLGPGATGPGSQRARIMLFESRPTEPDTAGWVGWCRAAGHDVFLPAVDGPDLRVEPGDVDPTTLDVVIVPGLGFTGRGDRLGQGGGHYDRFLARLAPGTLTIGVCFAEQLLDELPTEPHDRAVDHVVTD
jgi:5-formyltetrahydrofolate cyclo-ligase